MDVSVGFRSAISTSADGGDSQCCHLRPMKTDTEHRPLCTLELVAEGHAERCPGEECPFWECGCALTRVEHELDGRPDVAEVLLQLRRELESGKQIELEEAHTRFAHILNEEEGIE